MKMIRLVPLKLFVVTGILIFFGLLMMLSASIPVSLSFNYGAYGLIEKELIFLIPGLGLMLFIALNDYGALKKWAIPMLILSFILLVLVFTPWFRYPVRGACRWISIFGFRFAPAFFAIPILIIYFARALSNLKDNEHLPLKAIFVLTFCIILILGEPLRSAAFVLFLVIMVMLLAEKQYRGSIVASGIFFILMIGHFLVHPNLKGRLTGFLNPWHDYSLYGYQSAQSLISIGHNGLLGAGYGLSSQKWSFLPDAHCQGIFSIIAEELGMPGVLLVLILFLYLAWLGGKIAQQAKDKFGFNLAVGITSLFLIQVILHIASCLSFLPFGSVLLPFFSYGGSSLILNLIFLGILISIARQPVEEPNPSKINVLGWITAFIFILFFMGVFNLQVFQYQRLHHIAATEKLVYRNQDLFTLVWNK